MAGNLHSSTGNNYLQQQASLPDSTGRQLQAGQWVVQAYIAGRSSISTRIAYIETLVPDKGKVRLLKLHEITPGDWSGNDGEPMHMRQYILRPEDKYWDRERSMVSNTRALTIIDAAVAFDALPGLQEWIEQEWGGDISLTEQKVKSI